MFLKYLCPACNRYVELGDDISPADVRCPHCGGEVHRSQAPSRRIADISMPGYVKWMALVLVLLFAVGLYFASDLLMALAGGAIGIVIYFLPSFIARAMNHRNFTALFVLNLFLGWTILGWVGALVWALYKAEK